MLRDQLVALELADASAQLTAYAFAAPPGRAPEAVRAQAPDKAICKIMPVSVAWTPTAEATLRC